MCITIYIYLYLHVVCGQLFHDKLLETVLGNGNLNSTSDSFDSITKCIAKISVNELYSSPTVALLNHGSANGNFSDAVIDVLKTNHIPQVILEDLNKISQAHATQGNWLVVINLDRCTDLANLNFKIMNKQIKYLVLVPNVANNECSDILRDIGNDVGHLDVTFIEQVSLYHYKIFTFIPKINEYTCNQIVDEPTYINACINGSIQNKGNFPIKTPVNLNKCPFKVGMATLYPFSEIKDARLLRTFDSINHATGTDMEIMKIVAEYFNASLDLYYIYRKEEYPFGDYGFLKFVINGSLDACAGGLYRIYGDVVAYSGVYARQAVLWMYNADRADQSWQNLVSKTSGLYVFILLYFLYSFIWYFMCTFDKDAVSLKNTLLYSWGGLIGATSLQTARSLKQKIINLSYLVLCIYLSAYISIQLYSFLTIRGPPEIFKTNDDLMQSGRKAYLKTTTKYFVNDEKYLKFANTSDECSSFIDCAEKSLLHNGVTVMLQGIFYHFQALTAVEDEARILKVPENLLTVYNEMLIRKNSSLVQKFQKVVQRLFEAGITERLYYEAIGISVVAKADIANNNMVANSYSCQFGCAITFLQCAGVFYLWMFGCGLASCVFLLEIFAGRDNK